VPDRDKLFTANRLVPHGTVSGIRYIVWIDPTGYDRIKDTAHKMQLARIVGQLNSVLKGEQFILMGPGRWGSSDVNLGVKVSYADIDHASVLVEIALAQGGHAPEASYGTHFFQDLVESRIYPLPIYPDDPNTIFDWSFFENAPNVLGRLLPGCSGGKYVKVIDVPDVTGGRRLEIVMNGEEERALGYFK
jgi:pyruvate,water dikinase